MNIFFRFQIASSRRPLHACLEGSSTPKVKSFINNLWQHQQKNEFCDFTLITNGSPIECHKVVLSAASPYFRKLLLDDQNYKLLNIMDLSPTSLSVLNTAVAFMYNIDYNIEDDDVIELLKLSVKWQLDSLSKECSQYMSNNITIENAVMFYSFIVNNAEFCDPIKFRNFISKHFRELYEQGYLKELSLTNFYTLLADNNINVQTEDVVFSAAMEIINKHTSEADIDRCVGLIRFHQMSANFLLDVVQPHPVMLTQERCLLVREALRYQLTNQSSPSTTKGNQRAASDLPIFYIANNNIYRYIQDTSDATSRLVKNFPATIDGKTFFAFHANKLVVISRHKVILINMTGGLNIEHLSRLSYQGHFGEVVLSEDRIYFLNSLSDANTKTKNECQAIWTCNRLGRSERHANRHTLGRPSSGTSSNMSVLYLSFPNEVWTTLQPMPSAIFSPLMVANAHNIYVLGNINCATNPFTGEHRSMDSSAMFRHPAARSKGNSCFPRDQTGSMNVSVVYRYCTASNTWDQCNNFPAVVNRDNADVVVHDGAINVFTSTARFKYSEDSDTWSSDHYQLEGDLVKVFVKGNDIRCVTCQNPGYEQPNYGQALHGAHHGAYHHGAHHGAYHHGSHHGAYYHNAYYHGAHHEAHRWASAMETQKITYYLQTYDVSINQWIEKEQMDLGNKKPRFFF